MTIFKFSEYVAVVHKEKDTEYGISFPDFPGCISAGKTLDEVFRNGKEALEGHIGALLDIGETIPKAMSLDDATKIAKYKKTIHAYGLIQVQPKRSAIRVNTTFDPVLLDRIDHYVEEHEGLNRSAFLANIAQQYLDKHAS